MRHKFDLEIEVDDELLAEHDEAAGPPPKDVSEWDVSDLAAAIREGIVDPRECEVAWYGGEAK